MTDPTPSMPRRRPRIAPRPPGPGGTLPLPPQFTPDTDALDAEINRSLATGTPVDLSAVYPEPPPIAPGENPQAHHPVPGVDAPDPDPDIVPSGSPENMNPAQRLRHVSVVAPTYLDEYRSRLLHRLLLRRLPLDVIAQQLGCSVRNVQLMKTKLNKRAARQAKLLDVYDVAAESLRFYHEVRGLALRQVDNGSLHIKDRQSALRIALEAENDKIRFLSTSGYFEHAPFKPDDTKVDDPEQTKIDQTLAMLGAVVSGDTSVADIDQFFDADALGEDEGFDGMDPSTDLL